MGLSNSTAGAVDGDTLTERINKGLDEVKGNLNSQLGDQKMMFQVLKTLITYINKETQDPEFKTFLGYSLMGNHLLSTKAVQSYPPNMGMGIMALTKPEQLCYADCERSFASRPAILARIRAASKSMTEDGEGGQAVHAARMDVLLGRVQGEGPSEKGGEMAAEEEDEGPLESKAYAENKDAMLSVLEPYCDILEGLMSRKQVKLKSRFLKATKLSEDDLKAIRRKLGVATAIVKAFSPSDAGRDLKLPAFVGPESYGKSTLINHIVGRGVDSNIMPADPGMGTQVVCKVAPGAFESFRLASGRPGSKKGGVKEMLSEVNRTMKAKSEKGELGIRDMDMILAQKEFQTPVPMEFLDVPGIKESTAFHTSLALSMATSLVLVCGKVEYLSTQLEDGGDLQLLKDIVRELDEPLPIQCVVSFKVPREYFHKNRANYVKLLKEKFPQCCDVKEPLWMDFMNTDAQGNPGMSQREKETQVDTFMESAALGLKRAVDPYKKFLACQDEIDKFASALHTFFEQDLLEYRSQQDTAMGALSDNILDYNSPDGQKVDARLSKSMAFNVNDFLREVKSSDDFPRFNVGAASQVVNPVTIAQALLIDCRLAEMNWLLTQGRELHDQSFGEIYGPISDLCGVSEGTPEQQEGVARIFMQRVSQAYEKFNTQDDGKLKKDDDMQYWMKECCCKIAPYLDTAPFTWFVTGFYIVAGDSQNKHALMSQIQKRRFYPRKWSFREQLSNDLKSIKVQEWVQRCAGKKGRPLIESQFEVMVECCDTFCEIAESSCFLNELRNDCMEELLEFTYVMAERILAKKKNDDSVWVWTDFVKWLKQNAGGPHELKAKNSELSKVMSAEVVESTEVVALCNDALRLMKSSACSIPEWRQRMDQDIPEQLERLSACSKSLQTIPFGSSSPSGAALLISHATKEAVTKASSLFGGDGCAFPEAAEVFRHLASGKDCHIMLQDAPGPNLEDRFSTNAFDFISRTGMRVAVYMRRPDTQTYDPLDRERVMLEKLATQPNLTRLFVLWAPSHEKAWTIEKYPSWDVSRNKVGSNLKVEIIETRAPFQCGDFLRSKVLPAVQTAEEDAKANFQKLRMDVRNIGNEFRDAVSEFINTVESALQLTPMQFHDGMATEMRAKQVDRFNKSKLPNRRKDSQFQVPSKSFLGKVPEFTDKSVDQMSVDAAEASSQAPRAAKGTCEKETVSVEVVNELYARAFLFNVMLGQVVSMSSFLAGFAFKKLLAPLLDEIGAKFCMSGEDLREALERYVTMQERKSGDAASQDPEVRNMRMLLEMVTEDNFQHMYVGCVVYMLMPALYATVLPCVVDQDAADASDKAYRHHIARAVSMIGEQEGFCEKLCGAGASIQNMLRPSSSS